MNPPDFLVVDRFLQSIAGARALKSALELGIVDRLIEQGRGSSAALARLVGLDPPAMRLLVDLLVVNRVLEERDGDILLFPVFRRALRFRDLLEARLDYVGHVLRDFAEGFSTLLRSQDAFQREAKLFNLFDYAKALTPTAENLARTRAWMQVTTVLTRYEAQPCFEAYPLHGHRRVLDVGGNSGEFLRQICKAHPDLSGSVLDLPLVCDIGLDAMLGDPAADRIGFIRADLRRDPIPAGYDLVTFKSMLHDWPDASVRDFLAKAMVALPADGTLLIYERAQLRFTATPPLTMLPNLLFFRSYRPAEAYEDLLREAGFDRIATQHVPLDSPFLLITARKPAA